MGWCLLRFEMQLLVGSSCCWQTWEFGVGASPVLSQRDGSVSYVWTSLQCAPSNLLLITWMRPFGTLCDKHLWGKFKHAESHFFPLKCEQENVTHTILISEMHWQMHPLDSIVHFSPVLWGGKVTIRSRSNLELGTAVYVWMVLTDIKGQTYRCIFSYRLSSVAVWRHRNERNSKNNHCWIFSLFCQVKMSCNDSQRTGTVLEWNHLTWGEMLVSELFTPWSIQPRNLQCDAAVIPQLSRLSQSTVL